MSVRAQYTKLEHGAIKVSELKVLIGKDDPVIIEIGANVGQTTEEFLREMPKAKIYCFEPDPRAIRKFKDRIRSSNVRLFECAIGNKNGFVTFNQSSGEGQAKDWDQSGSIRNPKLHLETWPSVKFENRIEVPIKRLDDWASTEDIGLVDLVWADTQGAESDLIDGGSSVLKDTRFFYTEYGAIEWYEGQISLDGICDALDGIGLNLFRKFPMDALFLNRNLVNIAELNFKISRNAPCPCGSGSRFKHCHGKLS
jgi:2-O-methyltransferase